MALEMDNHELCTKISPAAQTEALLNTPGTQVYLERSRCFQLVAVKTLNPFLCNNAKEVESHFLRGEYFSPNNCRKLVSAGEPYSYSLTFDHKLVLTKMGYDTKDVEDRYPGKPAAAKWQDFFYDLQKAEGGKFQQELRDLPDFSAE